MIGRRALDRIRRTHCRAHSGRPGVILELFQEPTNGRSVDRKPASAPEMHEGGCATVTPEPAPEAEPATEIVR